MPLLTQHVAASTIEKLYLSEKVVYRACPKGYRLFPSDSRAPCTCSTPQFKPDGRPIATMAYFPFAKQLSTLVANDEFQEMLLNRAERDTPEEGVYADIFDGSVYKTMASTLFPGLFGCRIGTVC